MTNIQAADLLKGLEQSLDDYCELNDEGKAAFRMAITALESFGISEQLPSAEPEIIRCRDCKWFGEIGCAVQIVDESDRPSENDFCSFAERRTDEVD